jgi:hypothetical protein
MKTATKKPVTVVAAQRLNEGLEAAKKQLADVEKDIVTEAKKQRKSIEKVLTRVRSGNDLKQLEKRIASTANRNLAGRQGKGVRTHLMSPAMAAAAAVTGHLADVRRLG